jgi:mRNA interferase HigB
VKIVSRPLLREFWERGGCKHARQPLLAWFREVEKADWKSPVDVKRLYRSADLVGDGRVVFNIGGNKFRLIVWVKYSIKLVLIKWVGTHLEYDKIDVTKVGLPAAKRITAKEQKS